MNPPTPDDPAARRPTTGGPTTGGGAGGAGSSCPVRAPHDAAAPPPDGGDAARLAAVLDAVVDGIITIEESGRIESANVAAGAMFGWAPDELCGRNVSVLMPDPFRGEHDRYLADYLRTGEAKIIGVGRDVTGLRRDGTTFPMNLAVGEVRLPNRRLFTGIVRDLTAQRAAEDAVAERDRQIRFMVEHLPAGAVYADRVSGRLLCNEAVERVTGHPRAALATVDDWFRLLYPGGPGAARDAYDAAENDRVRVRTEEVADAAGARRTLETARYRYDHHEVWFVRDVTAERRAAEAIRQERDFSRILLETTQACITVVGQDGVVLRCNAAAERAAGDATGGAVVGRGWGDVFAGGRGGPAAALLGGGEVESVLCPTSGPGEGRREMLWWGRRLGEAERAEGAAAVLVGHDVTDLRRAQEQALRSERLAAIGQTVAGLAHEGRNALQRARAGLDVIAMDLPAARLPTVRKVNAALADLLRLYEEVREYAAPVRLQAEPLDLREVWRAAWRSAADAAAAGGGPAARLDEADVGPVPVVGDRLRLGQVFRNLFENAIAAGPPGAPVRVAAEQTVADDRPAVRVVVEDRGPGLSEERRTRAFEPFFTTKQRGTGLGLSIATRLIEAHGGSLSAGAAAGGGAAFAATLPLSPPG